MKRAVLGIVTASALAVLAGAASAQMGWGPGGGWGHGVGPGMGPGAYGGYPCAGGGMMGPGMGQGMRGGPGWNAPQAEMTEENAKQLAQQYADKYLKGFTVERVLPFTAPSGRTMYQAELKGPNEEARILHVNPWGNVMPFGGPTRRG